MIIREGVTRVFSENTGIRNISLEFAPGKIHALLGLNGAGKTTLLRCLEGLYMPDSGRVLHGGISTAREKEFAEYRRGIAYLPSEDFLYPRLSCRENIGLATILRTKKKKLLPETERLIEWFGVDEFLNQQPRASSGVCWFR